MALRRCLFAVLSLLVGLAFADTPAPPMPDTLAGHALGSWLDAFNTGNHARIDSFDKALFPALNLDIAMRFRGESGGLLDPGIYRRLAETCFICTMIMLIMHLRKLIFRHKTLRNNRDGQVNPGVS
jgi:hypothetical protein